MLLTVPSPPRVLSAKTVTVVPVAVPETVRRPSSTSIVLVPVLVPESVIVPVPSFSSVPTPETLPAKAKSFVVPTVSFLPLAISIAPPVAPPPETVATVSSSSTRSTALA